jgi:probable rRNA maturation factor
LVAVSVEGGDWPPKKELRRLSSRAVDAACAVITTSASLPPRGGTENAEMSIFFTNDAAVRRLNREWRQRDKPTNVLSFSQPSGPLLGDVVLAAETVRREAALAGKPLEDHIAHLVVHGFLHLLGYDHEDDAEAGKMEELERAALKRLGIPNPYARPEDQ